MRNKGNQLRTQGNLDIGSKSKVLRTRCSAPFYDRVAGFCSRTNQDISDVIRMALHEYMDRYDRRTEAENLATLIQQVEKLDPKLAEDLRKIAKDKLTKPPEQAKETPLQPEEPGKATPKDLNTGDDGTKGGTPPTKGKKPRI